MVAQSTEIIPIEAVASSSLGVQNIEQDLVESEILAVSSFDKLIIGSKL